MSKFDPSVLCAGDALVYLPDLLNPINRLICLKTWTKCSHVAVYLGEGKIAEAVFKGVGIYPFREKKIGGVLCPVFSFDRERSLAWLYSSALGQKYDIMALFRFYGWRRGHSNPERMICSEFATRYYRAGGGQPFNPEADADMISPAQFCQTSGFRFKWRSPQMPV